MSDEVQDVLNPELEYCVCPLCRVVFKFPVSDEVTYGAVCPSCNYLLRVDVEADLEARSSRQLAKEIAERRVPEWERKAHEYKMSKTAHIVVWSVSILILMGASFAGWKIANMSNSGVVSNGEGKVEEVTHPAELVARSFFNAKDEHEAKQYVHEATPGSYEKHFSSVKWRSDWEVVGVDDSLQLKGAKAIKFSYLGFEDHCFFRNLDGVWKLDWDSFSGVNKKSIDSFLEDAEQDELTLRCYAEMGDYYDFTHTSEEWVCLTLRVVGSQRVLYGYVHKDDVKLTALVDKLGLIELGANQEKVTLSLKKFEDKAIQNQFYIKQIHSLHWYKN